MRELSLLLLATAALLFSFAALWYSWKVTKAEPAVQTFVWEETTYIVATGPDGSVAITAHFDPLP